MAIGPIVDGDLDRILESLCLDAFAAG
jgi:hypothetical protein